MQRPDFNDIKSFAEFKKYYWYHKELKQICKERGIAYIGTKAELINNLEAYFRGEIIESAGKERVKKSEIPLTLDTGVLACGFVFNARFRDYFAKVTGKTNFKFTADTATALRKVRREHDENYRIRDLLEVYYGKSNYAKYDNSQCQWNQFFKDFCADKNNDIYYNKLKAAAILWNVVKAYPGDKVYTSSLTKEHQTLLVKFIKKEEI